MGVLEDREGMILDQGVDWITVTTKEPNASMHLSLWASSMLKHEKHIGNLERGWGMAGFQGFQCGEVQMGMREDECIVRLSGSTALRSWHEAYKRGTNVTRIDVQVTHVNDQKARTRITKHYKQALRWSKKFKRGPGVTLITGNDGCDTLYLGRRVSHVYGRAYSKGRQKKWLDHPEAVRYEVEFKDNLAHLVARKLAGSGGHGPKSCARTVEFFKSRGIQLPFSADPVEPIASSRGSTDILRRLEWLRVSCSPSVRAILEMDLERELHASLGTYVSDEHLRSVSDHSGPCRNSWREEKRIWRYGE